MRKLQQRRAKTTDATITATNLSLLSSSHTNEDEGNDKNKRRRCLINNFRTPFLAAVVFFVVIILSSLLFSLSDTTTITVERSIGVTLNDKVSENIDPQESIKHQQQQMNQKQPNRSRDKSTVRASSDAATKRMEAQSSRWVDGEKALKKKLQILYDRQQKGLDLGVPVLTRYLGEDIPAWITPDKMDENEWREKVKDKYEEMRVEEEEWKKKMEKIITQRERDIGITTA